MLFVLVVAIQQNINNFDLKSAKQRFHLSKILYIMLYFIISLNLKNFRIVVFVVGFAKK